jgi:hypothetical protein
MKLKKILIALLLIAVLLAGALSMAACQDNLPDNSSGVTITLIILDLDETELFNEELLTKKSSLYEVFNEFENLQISQTSSFLGAYITAISIGTIEENDYGSYFSESMRLESGYENGSYKYIALYHNINVASLKDAYVDNLTYQGSEYYYSAKGASKLPLNDGAVYLLKLATY